MYGPSKNIKVLSHIRWTGRTSWPKGRQNQGLRRPTTSSRGRTKQDAVGRDSGEWLDLICEPDGLQIVGVKVSVNTY